MPAQDFSKTVVTLKPDEEFSLEIRRIASALESLVEQGKQKDSPEAVSIGTHIYYADSILRIIETSKDMFALLSAMRKLESSARKTAEQLLVNM